jgi:hypothetical protein
MHSFFGRRTMIWACLIALGLSLAPGSNAEAKPDPKAKKGFRLFARAGGSLRVNQVQCGLLSDGQICVDSLGSSTIPGSVWPKGTNNQYTFNSGISIAGVIGPEVAGWAGDTTGAFFFDGGGTQNGEQIEPIFNSSDPADFNAWPDFAKVPSGTDPGAAVFDPLLQGANSASQGDVYFLYSDANPAALGKRPHPLGVAVETRGLAWNFPSGNQDIIYFIYTLYNITSINPADYALVRAPLQTILLEQAQSFQTRNEAAFSIDIPDGGYTLNDVFMAFAADQDVTAAAGANYATFNNAFNMAITYHEKFAPAPGNSFDPAIHGPPFLPGPGFVGTKYLRSPILPSGAEAGTVLAGMTTNRGSFPDPSSTTQLYRYISGNLNPTSDPQCNTGTPTVTHLCFVNPQPSDARTFQSSGPLTLAPGAQATIVVAYIFAAPLATGKCPSIPCPLTMAPNPLQLFNATPGSPGVNAVDSAMGYRGLAATASSPTVQEDFINLPQRSLLQKAIVAQTVFGLKFLLPFAPQAPEFFVVPGDNQVSILWQPSPSEASGDPFFAAANQPTVTDTAGNVLPNPVYDPNYRQNDVEGYRIYRSRTDSPNSLELVAQFDYAGTFISDFRGFVNPVESCAPELAPAVPLPPADPTCPFTIPAPGSRFVDSVDVPLVGDIRQIKLGGRVALANAKALVVSADTAVSGGGTGFPPLADTGVPFGFTDDGSGLLAAPRNNVRYFYSVTAFDINSLTSAPGSLESQRVTKPATPVKAASNVQNTSLTSGVFGDDGTQINVASTTPFTIDPQTGRFSGPPPATGGLSLEGAFVPLIPVLLPTLDLTATIDSVKPLGGADCGDSGNLQGLCAQFFTTFIQGGTTSSFSTIPFWPISTVAPFSEPASSHAELGGFAVAPDAAIASRFGIAPGSVTFNAAIGATLNQYLRFSAHENQMGRRLGATATAPGNPGAAGNVSEGGSRWFEGANETVDDPTYSIRVGHLTGVDTIFAPLSHIDQNPAVAGVQGPALSTCMQVFPYVVSMLGRQADIELTWGPGGTVASVRDITDHLNVPFHQTPQASYGFIPDRNGNGVIDWADIMGVEGVAPAVATLATGAAFCAVNHDPGPGARPFLTEQPTIGPVSTVITSEGPAGLAQTGTGFGLYINGQQFIFQLTGGTPPADGTKWTLRAYAGVVRTTLTTADSSGVTVPGSVINPSGYTYTPLNGSAALPGTTVQFTVAQPTQVVAATTSDLTAVHTVPDPYYVTNSFETTTTDKVIKFVNLPAQAIIRIYSSSGVLVSVLEHNSTTLGGDETWNVRNRNNQVVASGVYFYHIEAGGARRVGRFTVVNFAQ